MITVYNSWNKSVFTFQPYGCGLVYYSAGVQSLFGADGQGLLFAGI